MKNTSTMVDRLEIRRAATGLVLAAGVTLLGCLVAVAYAVGGALTVLAPREW